MELVGKKFKLSPELEENTLFYIESKLEDGYLISWIEQDGEEVNMESTTYDKRDVEAYINENRWILENE